MPNRYCRDELIKIALDMAQLPNLNIHDMPDGTVQTDAFAIQWLQDILDFWYHMVPFSATVDKVAANATANSDQITLPTDFILDVRNGYVVRAVADDSLSLVRRIRVPLQAFINRQLASQKSTNVACPFYYCIQGCDTDGSQLLKITPTPNIATQGYIWYYKLPAALRSNQKPHFPNDYVCIEYIRIRALEWARVYDSGTAQKFCERIIAGMKAAGLMNEPENDEVPFDELVFRGGNNSSVPYQWMGPR